MPRENQYTTSFKEWWIHVPKRWWEMLGVPLTFIPLFAGTIAFAIWARSLPTPLPWWNIGLVAGGALLFLIISFLAFHRVRVERDKARTKEVDNDVATAIEKLKVITITIGTTRLDAATILLQIWDTLAGGAPDYDVAEAIGKKFRLDMEGGSIALFSETSSVLTQLKLYGIVGTEQRRMYHGSRPPSDLTHWVLTEFGARVIRHLESEKK